MTASFGEEQLEDEYTAPAPAKYVDVKLPEDENASLLDELAESAEAEIAGTVRFPVDPDLRPGGWVLEFSKVIPLSEVRRWQRAATSNGKRKAEDADLVLANGLGLLDKNVGIYKGARQVFDTDGDPLTLRSMDWLTKVCKQNPNRPDTMAGLKHFLGDAQIIRMGSKLTREAGYDDNMEPVDPTDG